MFYQCVITIMLDSEEAAVVKENAAQLLANLAGMAAPLGIERSRPTNVAVLKKVDIEKNDLIFKINRKI